ncbi:MAG: hypothetical protein WDA60_02745 [Acidimicrobiia bacterium]
MVLVAGLLVLGLVFAIAAWFVVREAGRLTHEPPPVVFSLDEAYEWVVEELPDEVAATLTPADVRRILTFQVEYFDRSGVATNGDRGANGVEPHPPAIVGAAEVVDYILDRSATTGEEYIPEQVYPVVEILLEYLAATGAVSTPADPDPPLAP